MRWLRFFESDEKKAAEQLDSMKDLNIEPVSPPPGEFQKIIEEMDRRGIEPRLRKQLRRRNWFNRVRGFFHLKK